jgi:hypothetical protein
LATVIAWAFADNWHDCLIQHFRYTILMDYLP